MKVLSEQILFEWDQGNIDKNFAKHNVSDKEGEEVFKNEPVLMFKDEKHSVNEERYMVWGVTKSKRKLTVFFTFRGDKIRVISARDMHKKERGQYEKEIQKNS